MSKPIPTELNLHRQSRVLDISFDDGSTFSLPCEFLGVYSPSAEVQGHSEDQRVLQVGKENVNIERLEPVGSMEGEYEMVDDDGQHFMAPIPPFSLAVPNKLH